MDYRAHRQARRGENYEEKADILPEDERSLIAKLKLLHDQTRMSIIRCLHPHMRVTEAAVKERLTVRDDAFTTHMNTLLKNGFVMSGNEQQQTTYYLTNACRRVIERLGLLKTKAAVQSPPAPKVKPNPPARPSLPKSVIKPTKDPAVKKSHTANAPTLLKAVQAPVPEVIINPLETPRETIENLYRIPATQHGHRETHLLSAMLLMQERLSDKEWQEYARMLKTALVSSLQKKQYNMWIGLFTRAYALPPDVAQNIGSIVLTHPDKRTDEQQSLYDAFAKEYLRA